MAKESSEKVTIVSTAGRPRGPRGPRGPQGGVVLEHVSLLHADFQGVLEAR
jgi:hypothetical protein